MVCRRSARMPAMSGSSSTTRTGVPMGSSQSLATLPERLPYIGVATLYQVLSELSVTKILISTASSRMDQQEGCLFELLDYKYIQYVIHSLYRFLIEKSI